MEAVAVATAQQEPVLLVGETGTGKTTLVQQIAEQVALPCSVLLCAFLLYGKGHAMAMMITFVLIMMNKSIDYNSLSHLLGSTPSQNLKFPLIVQDLYATEQIERRANALC